MILIPDNDKIGRDHVDQIGAALCGIAKHIWDLDLAKVWAACPQKGDISARIEAGCTAEELWKLIDAAPPWKAEEKPKADPNTKDQSVASRQLVAHCAEQIQPKKAEWLWAGRFARGKVGGIAGEPGGGKSTTTIDIAARTSTGAEWPCGEGRAALGNVIIFGAEDGAADTTVPRLMAADADLSRVHLVSSVQNPDGSRRAFSLERDLDLLEEKIAEIGNVVLVIIDPISSYMGKTDSHKNSEVRGLLEPLGEIAERTRVAVLAVTHFNKGNADTKAMHRIIGSIAFVAMARTAFAVLEDAEKDGRYLFLSVKNNLAPAPQGLAYRLEQCLVGDGKDIVASRVVWDSAPVAITANEATAADAAGTETQTAKIEAIEFLQVELAAGPRFKKELDKAADEAGISDRTLKRAKRDLGIVAERIGGLGSEGKWVWRLPSHRSRNPSKGANDAYEGHVLNVAPLGNSGPLSANAAPQPPELDDHQ